MLLGRRQPLGAAVVDRVLRNPPSQTGLGDPAIAGDLSNLRVVLGGELNR